MAKRSGGTRQSGSSTGGVVQPVVDDSGYRNSETSLKYTYNPSKVKFEINDIERKLGIENISASDLRTKADFDFGSVQRGNDGKFNLGRPDYWFTENMSFAQAVNRAVNEIKTGYQNNENIRDHYMVVESEQTNLWATVRATLKDDNRVLIMISRYKGY